MPDAQPTQQFIEIDSIRNGVIVLKNGGLRRVLMVGGINFELKSEEERNIIIRSYQNFINALEFSVQILIHSRKTNINAYLKNLESRQEAEKNDLLKEQLSEYINFIGSFVENNAIMSKTFFVVVPFDSASISEGSSKAFGFLPFFKSKSKDKQEEQPIDDKISQLDQRTDQVVSGLAAIGLKIAVLNDEELIELFYNLYNPQSIETKGLKIAKRE